MTIKSDSPRRRMSAADRRSVVLEAAGTVFAERGYAGASIDAIAALAGISPPIIYRHFGSKKDLYLNILASSARELVEATTQDEGLSTAEEILRQNTRSFFRFVEENRVAWRILFLDPAPDPEIAEVQREIQAGATKRLAEVIVARVRELRVSPRVPRKQADELIAQAGKSALNGLAAWWWENPELSADTLADIAMDLLWTGLGNLGSG